MPARSGQLHNCFMVGLAKKSTAENQRSVTWRRPEETDVISDSAPREGESVGTEANAEMEIRTQIFAGLLQSIYHSCFVTAERVCTRNLLQHLYHL